jgi:uncharacterized membrane protein YedE/YeeE
MPIASKAHFLLFNSMLALVAGASAAVHGFRLWKHFTRVEVLGTGYLAFEAALAALMAGVTVVCAARLLAFWKSRDDGR